MGSFFSSIPKNKRNNIAVLAPFTLRKRPYGVSPTCRGRPPCLPVYRRFPCGLCMAGRHGSLPLRVASSSSRHSPPPQQKLRHKVHKKGAPCIAKCAKSHHRPPTDLIFPPKFNGFSLYSPRFPSCCEDLRMSIVKCLFPIPYTMVWAKRGAISNCVFYLNRGSKARLMAILISSASVDP